MSPRRAGRARPGLSRDLVLRAAVEYADARGLERLNMRVLAGRLKAGVMSIYNHVASKDDLLDGMVDRVAAEIALPADETGWREAIFEVSVSAHGALMRHPWAAPLWTSRRPGPAKLAHLESMLRILRTGGFSVAQACRGYHALSTHVVGFTLQTLDYPRTPRALRAAGQRFLASVDPEQIPYFAEHVRHHIDHPEPTNEFVFVLDLILDRLEHDLAEEGTP